MVKPELQNPDIAWKAAKKTRSPKLSKSFGSREKKMSSPPINSKRNVIRIMVINVDITEFNLFSPSISPNINWFLKEKPPEKKYPKKPVKVMIPSPPTWISAIITPCPNSEKLVEISVTVSPVIQTALVAIKKASIKLNGASIVVRGSISNTAPKIIRPKKLTTKRIVGLK